MKEIIKAVIFDVDGVLIRGQNEAGDFLWQENIEKDLGIKKSQVGLLFQKYWPLIGKGKLDTLTAITEFLSSLGSSVKAQDFLHYWHTNDSNLDHKMLEAANKLKEKGY